MSVRSWWLEAVAAGLLGMSACSLDATTPPASIPAGAGVGVAGAGVAPGDSAAANQAVAGSSATAAGTGGAGLGAVVVTAGTGGSAGTAADGVSAGASAGSAGVDPAGAAAAGAAGAKQPGDATSGTQGGAFIREANPTEASLRAKGEYAVKSYTEAMGLVGGSAYGDAAVAGDGSEVYYPEGALPPFAAIAIVPGFVAQRSDIAPWAAFLASHGIVGLAIDTNDLADPPEVRAQALLDALESLKKENLRQGSPLQGKLDATRVGIMGWSMGGGGAWIAADGHPELKVAVSLCGWIVGAAGTTTSVPSLQLAALDDGLAKGMSQPVYAAIPSSTPKMLVEWTSGGHWTNNDPANQNQQVGRYGLAWIKVFLEGDERYRPFLNVMPVGSSDFETNQM